MLKRTRICLDSCVNPGKEEPLPFHRGSLGALPPSPIAGLLGTGDGGKLANSFSLLWHLKSCRTGGGGIRVIFLAPFNQAPAEEEAWLAQLLQNCSSNC